MNIALIEEQKEFVHLLKEFGCSRLQTLIMCLDLAHPDNMIEMLEYMEGHIDATPAQLYEVCLRISSKRKQNEKVAMTVESTRHGKPKK